MKNESKQKNLICKKSLELLDSQQLKHESQMHAVVRKEIDKLETPWPAIAHCCSSD